MLIMAGIAILCYCTSLSQHIGSAQESTPVLRRKPSRTAELASPLIPHVHGDDGLPRRRRSHSRRKLFLETECTLYLRITEYHPSMDDHGQPAGESLTRSEDDQTWMCEMPMIFDERDTTNSTSTEVKVKPTSTASVPMMIVGIRGLSQDFFDSHGAKSGVTVLRVSQGYLEGSAYESSHGSGNRNEDHKIVLTTMVVPPHASVELNDKVVVSTSPTEDRIIRQRHLRPRNHASRSETPQSVGELTTLVIRVIRKDGVGPVHDIPTTRAKVFEDQVCLKGQLEACSKQQLRIWPFNGTTVTGAVIERGVVDVQIDVNPFPDNTTNTAFQEIENYRLLIEQRANIISTQLLGNLPDQFDLVLFCFPPGDSDNWIGYASVGRFDSYYNNHWCGRVSLQLHEVGHSLGLAHSGQRRKHHEQNDDVIYQDRTGMMGFSYPDDDWPRMCYNPAKNFQLGWYAQQELSIDPTAMVADVDSVISPGGVTDEFVLNGVNDYQGYIANVPLGSEDLGHLNDQHKLVVLRLEDTGRDNDYYVGYNRATGVNRDTQQDADMVVVVEKPSGGPYEHGQSWKIAALGYQNQMVVLPFDGSNENGGFVEIKLLNTTVGHRNSIPKNAKNDGTAYTNTNTNNNMNNNNNNNNNNAGSSPIDARIAITYYRKAGPCPNSNTVGFEIKGKTDRFGYQTSWSLRAIPYEYIRENPPGVNSTSIPDAIVDVDVDVDVDALYTDDGYVGFGSNYRRKEPFHDRFELCPRTCYVFTMRVSSGDDGPDNRKNGAHYEGILNSNTIVFREKNFLGSAEATHHFCVDALPPSSCEDDAEFRYKKRKRKNCSWVSREPRKRCRKRWKGKRILDWCPETCNQCGT